MIVPQTKGFKWTLCRGRKLLAKKFGKILLKDFADRAYELMVVKSPAFAVARLGSRLATKSCAILL